VSDDGELHETVWDEFNVKFEFWWEAFTSWAAILASQDLVGPPEWDWSGPDREGWSIDAHGHPAGFKTGKVLTKAESPTHRVLELQDLEACVTAAGNQGPPPAEWLFIRDARSLLNGGDNRRAVIEAATAAEVAMNTLIGQYHATVNTDELVKEALEKRCRSLEGCTAVLKTLRTRLETGGLQKGLIEPRNDAVHRGESITEAQALTALDIATGIVDLAHPLAGLLSM
jgi:hypothetical protein